MQRLMSLLMLQDVLLSCRSGDLELIQALIEHGADIGGKCLQGVRQQSGLMCQLQLVVLQARRR